MIPCSAVVFSLFLVAEARSELCGPPTVSVKLPRNARSAPSMVAPVQSDPGFEISVHVAFCTHRAAAARFVGSQSATRGWLVSDGESAKSPPPAACRRGWFFPCVCFSPFLDAFLGEQSAPTPTNARATSGNCPEAESRAPVWRNRSVSSSNNICDH